MGKIINLLDGIIQKLTSLATVLAGMGILLTAVIVCYEVIMRGLFNAPTEWSIEVSVYLILVSGFLGMAVTYADDKHIRVDILTSRLSARTNTCLNIFVGLVSLIFCVIFLRESWDMALVSYQLDRTSPSTLRVPLFIPQLALPVGFFLLLLQLIRKIIIDVYSLIPAGWFTGDSAAKRREA
ncbi:hypothetical protein SCACP_33880 [Sporomusa carbonis]|uniref:TRAP transporter small permease subunit n=1 Tax=Sporomusa carbonis TaxID=3076075 RepID=UPI003A7675F1